MNEANAMPEISGESTQVETVLADYVGRSDYIGTATYSPEDNKLRITPFARLSAEDYARVKAAGYGWAPKQGVFVAPMWTPSRADLAEELCGEIDDEDTTLAERAEQRADRFEEYSEKRSEDGDRARAGVSAIADNIPFGQPILIGHHSERRARKDAERIQNGMRRAVKMWETSEYWTRRAAGAIAHAKYKERPDVRQRRIKTIEADLRKVERNLAKVRDELAVWESVDSLEQARRAANIANGTAIPRDNDRTYGWSAYDVLQPDGERYTACPAMDWEKVRRIRIGQCERYLSEKGWANRWLAHYKNRLAYERAMLAEQGGTAADRWKFEVGGQVMRRGKWFRIVRVNPQSVSVRGHFATTVTFDEITDYQAPTPEEQEKTKAASKLPPLCNYPGEGFRHMTYAELMGQHCRKWSDFPKTGYRAATETHGAHRVQQTRSEESQWKTVGVFITDKPRKDPPTKKPDAPALPQPTQAAPQPRYVAPTSDVAEKIDAVRASLAAGVQVAVAPQLFPTPPELARRMVELAGVEDGHRVLEPSAGTGAIMAEIGRARVDATGHAIEINGHLVEKLRANFPTWENIAQGDFLSFEPPAGKYDRILMNPPFANGSDIKHILHARRFLKEGGRLVAICANGPRQREQLMPLADLWEDLPAGTFAEQGTQVNTALLVIQS